MRRIPSTISLGEIALFSVAIVVLMPVLWYAFGDPGGALVVLIVGTGLMLFAPFSSWRFRCNALAMEFTRPAARDVFLRQMLCAMALDFCLWTSAATLVAACGQLFFVRQNGFNYFVGVPVQVVTMWGFAVLLFGIGLDDAPVSSLAAVLYRHSAVLGHRGLFHDRAGRTAI